MVFHATSQGEPLYPMRLQLLDCSEGLRATSRIENRHIRARSCQFDRRRRPDPSGSARNDRHFPFNIEHRSTLWFRNESPNVILWRVLHKNLSQEAGFGLIRPIEL